MTRHRLPAKELLTALRNALLVSRSSVWPTIKVDIRDEIVTVSAADTTRAVKSTFQASGAVPGQLEISDPQTLVDLIRIVKPGTVILEISGDGEVTAEADTQVLTFPTPERFLPAGLDQVFSALCADTHHLDTRHLDDLASLRVPGQRLPDTATLGHSEDGKTVCRLGENVVYISKQVAQ